MRMSFTNMFHTMTCFEQKLKSQNMILIYENRTQDSDVILAKFNDSKRQNILDV